MGGKGGRRSFISLELPRWRGLAILYRRRARFVFLARRDGFGFVRSLASRHRIAREFFNGSGLKSGELALAFRMLADWRLGGALIGSRDLRGRDGFLAMVAGGRGGPASTSVAAWAGLIILRFAGRSRLFGDQRLAIGDRDLVVIRVDFAECQETVPVAAIIDEGRLKRRLDPHHLRKIDVPP